MTDKQFIEFSKDYFGDLDYKRLTVAEYKSLYEDKEASRINNMIKEGKIKFNLKAQGMKVTLLVNEEEVATATLVAPVYNNTQGV